jgi:DNA (cytosine-5)-methyltransferase 1
MQKLTFLSLFAGIGGFDLGLERAGMQCVGQVEIDLKCQQPCKLHSPDMTRLKLY